MQQLNQNKHSKLDNLCLFKNSLIFIKWRVRSNVNGHNYIHKHGEQAIARNFTVETDFLRIPKLALWQ